MKLHLLLIRAVAEALNQIFFEKKYPDKVIERAFKTHRQWGARDRRFFAENVYECVRWWRKYWFLLNQDPHPEAVEKLWAIHYALTASTADIPASLVPDLNQLQARLALLDREENLAVRHSVTDWLWEQGLKERGSQWANILSELNKPAPVDLRVNTLRTDAITLVKELKREGIAAELVAGQKGALTLLERKNLFATQAFKQGLFEVQDRASQRIAPLLRAEPGERIIDTCAGAGGKTLHLGTLMNNKGKIIALDIFPHKLEELLARAKRNGLSLIETRHVENRKIIKRLNASADRILLDVPCTGVGVLRRNPDKKWKLSMDELERLRKLQRELLTDYSSFLKPKGIMVYATCSIFPTENQEQIAWFLDGHPNWKLLSEQEYLPSLESGDGFYAAVLQKLA